MVLTSMPVRRTLVTVAAAWTLHSAFALSCRRGSDLSAPHPPADPGSPAANAPTRATALGAGERAAERARMVETQIAAPVDGREPISSAVVLAAVRAVPRHAFVPEQFRELAYADTPLPIGSGQTISQPYVVAKITALLELGPESRVLEVGVGSGYQAAVLAHITPHVFGVEIVPELCERARRDLATQGYSEVALRCGDGYFGWKEHAPFDGIIVSCAADEVPAPLWEQLRPGGRIVIPLKTRGDFQELVVVAKTAAGERVTRSIAPVRFVPLTRGKDGEESSPRGPRR